MSTAWVVRQSTTLKRTGAEQNDAIVQWFINQPFEAFLCTYLMVVMETNLEWTEIWRRRFDWGPCGGGLQGCRSMFPHPWRNDDRRPWWLVQRGL